MEISFNTPAILFPAISLLMLAYTNRFVALASLARKLHDEYDGKENQSTLVGQIRSLKKRINYIRYMQGFGVLSFLLCVVCMYSIYSGWLVAAKMVFAASLLSLLISLFISLIEIIQSTKALELELSDVEDLAEENLFTNILKKTRGEEKK